jgi:DNA anti-recombination protein RmuC
MEENKNPQNQQPLQGEITTIRDILMGGHINQYESQFTEIRDNFSKNDADKDARFQALEAEMNQRFNALQTDMNSRFDKLEALLTENVQRLNERVNAVSTSDKADLGRLLAEVSNRLING